MTNPQFRNIDSERALRAALWALEAGKKAMDVFHTVTPETKADDSYVTEADRDIETFLREKIKKYCPADRIMGEEDTVEQGSGNSWYLDPIDGTAAYATELPIWAVSVGIWNDANPLEGVLYAPFVEDLYVYDGRHSRKNGRVLDKPDHDEWTSESLLCVPSNTHRKYRIDFPGKTRCLGSTAYHMAMVLDGRAVSALIGRPHIWDVAAVVAMGDPLDFVCRGIESGEPPDWSSVCEGERPREPLLFGRSSQIERLLDRIGENPPE